jgi:ABC-type antimicrobial peptide transport system permease subunit
VTDLALRRPERVPWGFRQPLVLRSAVRRWRSTLAMVIGVGVALGIVLVLAVLSQGIFGLLAEDYLVADTNLYVIEHGATFFPVVPGDDQGTLRDATHRLALVRRLPGVRGAFGVLSGQIERTREGPRRDTIAELLGAAGIDGDPARVGGALLLTAGRWLRRGDEVVLGTKLARDKGLAVGDSVLLDRRRFDVVGIGRVRGVGLGSIGGGGLVFMDYRTLRDITRAGDTINVIYVAAADPAATRERLLGEIDSVDVVDRTAALAALTKLAEHDIVFMRAGAVMALAIAAVFVASMLGRSVAERRAELATLRAIGVPQRTILGMVLAEALLVTGLACPLAIAIGQSLGTWINRIYREQLDMDAIYRLDLPLLLSLVGSAIVLGLLAALLPARQALAVQPADVLREA